MRWQHLSLILLILHTANSHLLLVIDNNCLFLYFFSLALVALRNFAINLSRLDFQGMDELDIAVADDFKQWDDRGGWVIVVDSFDSD